MFMLHHSMSLKSTGRAAPFTLAQRNRGTNQSQIDKRAVLIYCLPAPIIDFVPIMTESGHWCCRREGRDSPHVGHSPITLPLRFGGLLWCLLFEMLLDGVEFEYGPEASEPSSSNL